MRKKHISILGCGWLGLPLGQHLARRGHHVKGSTTTPEKLARMAEAGIEPYLITLNPGLQGHEGDAFLRADVLFINIPPSRRDPEGPARFSAQLRALQTELHYTPVKFVLFASSTSVYEDLNCEVVETDARTAPPWHASGAALFETEQRLRDDTHFDTTVLRFAGLYGYQRQPGRFLAGRQGVKNGGAPVNLVHRDDCIEVITQIIEEDIRGEVFNVCSDDHPARHAFYAREAERLGLEPPVFADLGATSFKVVSNEKLKQRLGYRFRYPSPYDEAP